MPSITGGAIIGAGVLGAGASLGAAEIQSNAAQSAANAQLNMYNQSAARLQPFVGAGSGAIGALQGLTGTNAGGNPLTAPLTKPFQPTLAQLQQTPGYQFTLQQGLESTQNGFAAQGLGQSGAAQKGAINYAEGLAGTTYQQQFQNYLSQNQQIYNMLGGLASQGENAAAGVGNQGIQSQALANQLTTSGAAAQAAGLVGAANSANNTGLLFALNNSGIFGPNTGGSGSGLMSVGGGSAGG